MFCSYFTAEIHFSIKSREKKKSENNFLRNSYKCVFRLLQHDGKNNTVPERTELLLT